MDRLLLYHDFTSPFCRLAVQLAPEAAGRTGLALRAVPFEIRPAPATLPAAAELDDDEMATARQVAREWGLELGRPAHVPRTRKAHEAVAFARTHEAEIAMLTALYSAFWQDGADIGRMDVLAEIGGSAGLDPESLHVALGVDDHEDAVVREQEAAAAAGLTGVPAVQVGDRRADGLLPLDELIAWIESRRPDRREQRESGSGGET